MSDYLDNTIIDLAEAVFARGGVDRKTATTRAYQILDFGMNLLAHQYKTPQEAEFQFVMAVGLSKDKNGKVNLDKLGGKFEDIICEVTDAFPTVATGAEFYHRKFKSMQDFFGMSGFRPAHIVLSATTQGTVQKHAIDIGPSA